MALPFIPSDAALLGLQAALVAVPRALPSLRLFRRLRGPAWALVPLASIVGIVFLIRFASDSAKGLTYLALVAVPPLAAAALAWAGRPAGPLSIRRTALAIAGAGALFAVAWAARRSLAGEAAAAILSGLSCVTLAALLAAVCPPGWLKLGIVAMAAADVWLVVSDLLQAPNAALVLAHPGAGLPRLQSELFGSVSMGYGDLFVAALLGAVLAGNPRRQLTGAGLTLLLAAGFDLLFLAVNELPATVPVALALVVLELRDRMSTRYARQPSPRAVGTPRPAR